MTPKEFVIWMKGFITACPKFHPTPEQWDLLKDQLEKVETGELKTIPTGPIPRSGYVEVLPNGTAYTFTTSDSGNVHVNSKELIKRIK